jgi:hypothetical protein
VNDALFVLVPQPSGLGPSGEPVTGFLQTKVLQLVSIASAVVLRSWSTPGLEVRSDDINRASRLVGRDDRFGNDLSASTVVNVAADRHRDAVHRFLK